MKRVMTAWDDFLAPEFAHIVDLLQELPHSEAQFVILDRHNENDSFIQATLANPGQDENSPFLIETRRYESDGSWRHYRRFSANATEALPYFAQFYRDEPFAADGWEDVSDEFED